MLINHNNSKRFVINIRISENLVLKKGTKPFFTFLSPIYLFIKSTLKYIIFMEIINLYLIELCWKGLNPWSEIP